VEYLFVAGDRDRVQAAAAGVSGRAARQAPA
jgi:hypothetical protein